MERRSVNDVRTIQATAIWVPPTAEEIKMISDYLDAPLYDDEVESVYAFDLQDEASPAIDSDEDDGVESVYAFDIEKETSPVDRTCCSDSSVKNQSCETDPFTKTDANGQKNTASGKATDAVTASAKEDEALQTYLFVFMCIPAILPLPKLVLTLWIIILNSCVTDMATTKLRNLVKSAKGWCADQKAKWVQEKNQCATVTEGSSPFGFNFPDHTEKRCLMCISKHGSAFNFAEKSSMGFETEAGDGIKLVFDEEQKLKMVEHNGKEYTTFAALPTKVANILVKARVELAELDC